MNPTADCSRRIVIVVLLMALAALAEPRTMTARADDSPPQRIVWATGRALQEELRRPVNIVLNRTTPRQVVERLRELHQIAVLLDRRIDPDRRIDVQYTRMSLDEALQLLAVQLEGELARIGGTLWIAPAGTSDRIRTLIALRTVELKALDTSDAIGRQFELLRGTTLAWQDLAEPATLVEDVCGAFHVKRTGEGRVPHDLWRAGVMADVNALEALGLLLGQFDLTFAWTDEADGIAMIPVPESVTLRREHIAQQLDAAAALVAIREKWPHLQPTASGRTIVVEATAGEHEAIATLLAPQRPQPDEPPTTQGPLSRRRFTLKATRAEAIAILRTLQVQDVIVEYDPQQLQQAGIDLREMVTLELDQAPAEELFRQLCEPLGLHFAIEGKTVRLTPRDMP